MALTMEKNNVYYPLMPKINPKDRKSYKKMSPNKKTKSATPKTGPKTGPKKGKEKKAATKAAAPKKAAMPKPKSKVPFKKEITQKLLQAKTRIIQEVSQKVKSESNTLKFEIGDIYDIASSERDRELSLILGDRDREKLSEIDDALGRINDSTYGVCEECGEQIAEDRLRALPFTRVCVECQSRNEKEQRIKGRVEEEPGLGILEKSEGEEEEF